jgi:hypothetical protein
LSRWKTRPVPETEGVQVTSIFAKPMLVLANEALPVISVSAVLANVSLYEKVLGVTAVMVILPLIGL